MTVGQHHRNDMGDISHGHGRPGVLINPHFGFRFGSGSLDFKSLIETGRMFRVGLKVGPTFCRGLVAATEFASPEAQMFFSRREVPGHSWPILGAFSGGFLYGRSLGSFPTDRVGESARHKWDSVLTQWSSTGEQESCGKPFLGCEAAMKTRGSRVCGGVGGVDVRGLPFF